MNTRAARNIRAGILDARARRIPWWSPMGQRAMDMPYDSELRRSVRRQSHSSDYMKAYERSADAMPAPKPPRGGSGISRRKR